MACRMFKKCRMLILCEWLLWWFMCQGLFKDDFFDSLSCDALDRQGGRGERTRFSEQRKIDTEVGCRNLRACLNMCILSHTNHELRASPALTIL